MLVENYLVAVISLPAGVFQPYSGVKTSILILDKTLAKKTDRVAFFKVENDGFDLGAQRRAVAENDLPQVTQAVREYLNTDANMDAQDRQDKAKASCPSCSSMLQPLIAQGTALIAEKGNIAANGEYNLSGERYRETVALTSGKWPLVALRDLCSEILSGGTPSTKKAAYWQGDIPWITSADIVDIQTAVPRKYITEAAVRESATNIIPRGNVIVVTRVGLGKLFRNDFDVCISQDSQGLILKEGVSADFLVYVLRDRVTSFKNTSQGSTIQGVTKRQLAELQIPLPPLEVQREIVAEIEGYQRVIDGARAVIDNYRPQITVDPEWPLVAVREVCIVNPKKSEIAALNGATPVSFVPMSDIAEHTMYFEAKDCKSLKEIGSSYTYFKENDVLIAKVTPCFENGKAGIAKNLSNRIGFGSSEFYVLRPTKRVLSEWLFLLIATPAFRAWAKPQMTGTGGLQRVQKSVLERYKIPLPDLTIQQQFAAEVEAEQKLVNANRELIERFEKKIQAAIARVWGERSV